MNLLTALLTAVAVILAGFVIQNANYRRRARSRGCQPPAQFPHKDPIFGLDAFIETGKMFSENTFFATTLNRFSSLGRTFEITCLRQRSVHSIEPENIQNVFATNADKWGVHNRWDGMSPYFGKGFLTVDGPEWHRSRQAFSHSFHRTNITDHATFDHYLSLLINKIPRDGSTVDLQELNFALYVDTSTLFLFGESFESLSTGLDDDAKGFVRSLHKSFEGCGIRQGLGPLRFLYRDASWPIANAQNHAFIQKYADQALARQASTADSGSKGRKLFLDALAQEVNDPIQLRNEVIHAFTAANETTACLVSNIMWILARRPEIWSRVRGEVLALGDRELNFDNTSRLPYLQNVINETLRLYPVFPWHIREAFQDCTIPTGGGADGKSPVYIRAGDRFEASFVALHRDKKIWGPDSEIYRPERWETFHPEAWQFVPFGGGPRGCVGKQKALSETAFYVARMVREFRGIEPRDEREWVGEVKITAKSFHGVKVALTPA